MISERIKNANESITLKLNAKAEELRKEGKKVYNLTAGQLPYKPSSTFVGTIEKQLNFLSSYQYSPVAGLKKLTEKAMNFIEETRGIELPRDEFACMISTGAKQSVFNLIGTIIDPEDEVVLIAPYWISYPEMVKYWGGRTKVVSSRASVTSAPNMDDIRSAMTDKTKAIIINSPGNPSGYFYDESWMKDFAEMISDYPKIAIISDEIYFKLNYYDPKPSYPYHYNEELLKRTFIIEGISKAMACTGLRIGYTIGPKDVIKGMGKIQGQSTSGANSLIQGALVDYDFADMDSYLAPIKNHLRVNSEITKELLEKYHLEKAWYQTNSAFYFFIDFSSFPIMNRFKKSEDDKTDYAFEVCQALIQEKGVVIVPGTDFGVANAARMSLVLERQVFTEALEAMFDFFSQG